MYGDHTGSFYVQNGQVAQLVTINQTLAMTVTVNAGGVAYLPTSLKLLGKSFSFARRLHFERWF